MLGQDTIYHLHVFRLTYHLRSTRGPHAPFNTFAISRASSFYVRICSLFHAIGTHVNILFSRTTKTLAELCCFSLALVEGVDEGVGEEGFAGDQVGES